MLRFTALQHALNEGFTDIATFLLDQGAHVNTWFHTPSLSLAAKNNKPALIQKILEKGAQVNPPVTNSLFSPLSMLVMRNHNLPYQEFSESVNLLLDAGALVNSGLKTYLDKKQAEDNVEPMNWKRNQNGRYTKAGVPTQEITESLKASL